MKAATLRPVKAFYALCISIHAAREGGDLSRSAWEKLIDISIHAAREGGDMVCPTVAVTPRISIHAAREGGDHGIY